MRKILQNALVTPDGTVLISTYVHDYQSHTDKKTEEIFTIDGGLDYIIRTKVKPLKDLTLYEDSPFEEIREKLLWGTRGKHGLDPLTWIYLKDMSYNHIKAVLDILPSMNIRHKIFNKELKQRRK